MSDINLDDDLDLILDDSETEEIEIKEAPESYKAKRNRILNQSQDRAFQKEMADLDWYNEDELCG